MEHVGRRGNETSTCASDAAPCAHANVFIPDRTKSTLHIKNAH